LEGIAAMATVNVTGKKLSILGPVISVKRRAASRAMACCRNTANLANLAGGWDEDQDRDGDGVQAKAVAY
jgi:hypothetical protein